MISKVLDTLTPLLALAEPAAQSPAATDPNPTGMVIKQMMWLIPILVLFWMMTIGPQRKRQKQLDQMMKNLKSGDKVVTSSGILGVVVSIKDKTVSLRSADTKLEVLKSAI